MCERSRARSTSHVTQPRRRRPRVHMSTNPKLTLTALITILCATPAAAQQLLAPSGHASALLPDKTIVVIGGDGGSNGIPPTKAIYFPAGSDVAVQAGSLVLPRTDHTAVSMYDGRILVVGGNDGYGGMESLEIFDPSTMTFTLSKAVLSAPRQECRAIGLADGRVLIRGGYDRDVKVTLDEIYDPRTDTVTVAPAGLSFASIKTDRYEYLPGDTVYVSGSGFAPGENVDLLFDEDPLVHVPATYSSVADQNGSVTDWATYHVDLSDFGTAFTLHAAGAISGLTSTALFADGANLHGTAIPNTVTIPAGGSASIQVGIYYT